MPKNWWDDDVEAHAAQSGSQGAGMQPIVRFPQDPAKARDAQYKEQEMGFKSRDQQIQEERNARDRAQSEAMQPFQIRKAEADAIKAELDANKVQGIKPADPMRRKQILSLLGEIQKARELSGKMLTTGKLAGDINDIPVVGSMFTQNRNNIEGHLNSINGDIIQQQVQKLMAANGGGVSGMANTEQEAARMAGAIANLSPDQDEQTLLSGLDRAEAYYNNLLDTLPPDQGSENKKGGAGSINRPEMVGDLPVGTDVRTGFQGGASNDEYFDRAAYLGQFGATPNEEVTMTANLNANLKNPNFNADSVNQIFDELGIQRIDGPQAERIAADIRKGIKYGGFNTSDAKKAYEEKLKNAAQDVDKKEGEQGLGSQYLDATSFNLDDEAKGAGAAIGATLRGKNPLAAYQAARDVERYRNDKTAEKNGWWGTGAEVAGVVSNPIGWGSSPARIVATGALSGFGGGEGTQGSLMGASFGGITGYAGQKGLNSVAEKMATKKATSIAAKDIIDQGNANNIAVMTSDVLPPQTRLGKLSRTIGENIPFAGTGGARAEQQAQRQKAITDLLQEYGYGDAGEAVEKVSADLVKNRSDMLNRFSTEKKSIIESVGGIIPARELLPTLKTIDTQISKLEGVNKGEYAPVIAKLQSFRDTIASGKTLEQIEGNRSILGSMFQDPSLASIKDGGQKALNAIYGPLRNDMGSIIEARAGRTAQVKWKNANDKLASMAGEMNAKTFKNVLGAADTTPEAAAKILFGKTPSDMQKLARNLTPQGQTNAQRAVLFKASEDATDTAGNLSPQRFANALDKYSKATGVFFNAADKARIDGLGRVLRATQNASEAGASPMTGAQNTPLIAGVSLGSVFGTAALPATALAGMIARGYESKLVRNLLTNLGNSNPGSIGEKKIGQALKKALVRYAPAGVTKTEPFQDDLDTSR